MKKILISFFVITFMLCGFCNAKSYYNAQTNSAIKMYKNRNYTECLQVMYDVVNKDPSNVLGYYYIAIAHARLGDVNKAKEAYQRVIDLNSSTQLTKYAKNGIECLDDSTKCKSEVTVDPTAKAMDTINQTMIDQRINSVKDIMNTKKNIQDIPSNYMRDFKDYSLPQNQLQNKSEAPIPTKEEIADALDTLKRAGYQNVMPQPAMTQEMMQLSMLNSLSGNNQNYNNPMASYMPYMMNSQDMAQIDPQLMQTMMMNSMMNGLYSDLNSNK